MTGGDQGEEATKQEEILEGAPLATYRIRVFQCVSFKNSMTALGGGAGWADLRHRPSTPEGLPWKRQFDPQIAQMTQMIRSLDWACHSPAR